MPTPYSSWLNCSPITGPKVMSVEFCQWSVDFFFAIYICSLFILWISVFNIEPISPYPNSQSVDSHWSMFRFVEAFMNTTNY